MSDIDIRFGYVNTQDSQGFDSTEPALAIVPKRLGSNLPTYAIPLSSAYKYADGEYLIKSAFNAANHLQMFPDRFLVYRIADLILIYLPDLIKMKPFAKKGSARENGEGKVLIDGDVVSHFGITESDGILL